jgi:hypothetical protein
MSNFQPLRLSRFEENRNYSRSIVSSHLSFVEPRPTPMAIKIARMKQVKTMPTEVIKWLDQVLLDEDKVAQATATKINARKLASRIVHKFFKWGNWRFYPNSRTDFYDGTDFPEGTQPQTLAFGGELREALLKLMNLVEIHPDAILSNNSMYLGPESLNRFSEFIRVVPQPETEVVAEPEQSKVVEEPVVEEPVVEEVKQDMENVPIPVESSENVPKFEVPITTENRVIIPDASQVVSLEVPAPAQSEPDASWGSWLYSWVASAPVETPATTQAQL